MSNRIDLAFVQVCSVVLLLLIRDAKNDWVEIAQSQKLTNQKQQTPISTTAKSDLIVKGTVQRAEVKKFKSYPAHIEKLHTIKSAFANETWDKTWVTTERPTRTTLATTEKIFVTESTRKLASTRAVFTEATLTGSPRRFAPAPEPDHSSTTEQTVVESSVTEYSFINATEYIENDSEYTNMGFVPYLKAIQDTLVRNTRKTIKSKVKFLKQLRDSLLVDIEDRMDKMWTPESNSNRDARDYKEEDSHMDFPSNEGALMTIGFLTFAVFLIKLVLKLIHVVKAKHNNQNMMSNMSTMSSAYIGRKRRDLPDEEDIRILSLIEEYKLN